MRGETDAIRRWNPYRVFGAEARDRAPARYGQRQSDVPGAPVVRRSRLLSTVFAPIPRIRVS